MQRVVEFGLFGPEVCDLANRVQHGRMIPATEEVANFWHAFLGQLLG